VCIPGSEGAEQEQRGDWDPRTSFSPGLCLEPAAATTRFREVMVRCVLRGGMEVGRGKGQRDSEPHNRDLEGMRPQPISHIHVKAAPLLPTPSTPPSLLWSFRAFWGT
jgi:hypothetical protein